MIDPGIVAGALSDVMVVVVSGFLFRWLTRRLFAKYEEPAQISAPVEGPDWVSLGVPKMMTTEQLIGWIDDQLDPKPLVDRAGRVRKAAPGSDHFVTQTMSDYAMKKHLEIEGHPNLCDCGCGHGWASDGDAFKSLIF